MPPMLNVKRSALLLCAAVGASACSDATSSNAAKRPFSVSLTSQSQAAVADRARADITVATGTSTLVITKAQLLARRIELAPASASGCTAMEESSGDDAEVEDGCAEVEVGPALLDIPVDASLETNISASVPAGTYRALEIRIRPESSGNRSGEAFLAAHPEFKGVSIRIQGTFNGKAFVFTSAIDTRIETAFATPVTVDATNPNVTVAIDLSKWFSDGSGGTLDPSNSSNAARIAANIAGSFRAFEDDDHDGHDDHR
ncbi:MAG TPA: hypothetical protein VGH98_14800 [Gemmatimonadaceae bacterium]